MQANTLSIPMVAPGTKVPQINRKTIIAIGIIVAVGIGVIATGLYFYYAPIHYCARLRTYVSQSDIDRMNQSYHDLGRMGDYCTI